MKPGKTHLHETLLYPRDQLQTDQFFLFSQGLHAKFRYAVKRLPSFSKTLKNADFIAERRSLAKVKEVKEATDITSVLHRRLIFYSFSIIKQNFVL